MRDSYSIEQFTRWPGGEMDKRGWSQSELARRSRPKITPTLVSQVMSGQKPGEKFLTGIAFALGIPREEVFRRAGLLPEPVESNPLVQQLTESAGCLGDRDLQILVELARRLAITQSMENKHE